MMTIDNHSNDIDVSWTQNNSSHVVQGGPISNHLSRGVNVQKPFHDADLYSVSFQEYHPDFPHKKYTLGYGMYFSFSFIV